MAKSSLFLALWVITTLSLAHPASASMVDKTETKPAKEKKVDLTPEQAKILAEKDAEREKRRLISAREKKIEAEQLKSDVTAMQQRQFEFAQQQAKERSDLIAAKRAAYEAKLKETEAAKEERKKAREASRAEMREAKKRKMDAILARQRAAEEQSALSRKEIEERKKQLGNTIPALGKK